MTVVMILMAMMPVTMTTGTTCGGWEFSWVGASWIWRIFVYLCQIKFATFQDAVEGVTYVRPGVHCVEVTLSEGDGGGLKYDLTLTSSNGHPFLEIRCWGCEWIEMERQFLESPLGIESDMSQDEDVVPWDGVPWEEDDWPGHQLVKKLKIGHIGAAGKAGQIGADRLKDDIEESSTFPKHCQGLALLIVPMHPLACSTKLRMAFKAGIIWNWSNLQCLWCLGRSEYKTSGKSRRKTCQLEVALVTSEFCTVNISQLRACHRMPSRQHRCKTDWMGASQLEDTSKFHHFSYVWWIHVNPYTQSATRIRYRQTRPILITASKVIENSVWIFLNPFNSSEIYDDYMMYGLCMGRWW